MEASEESIRMTPDPQSKTCLQNQDTHIYQEKKPSAQSGRYSITQLVYDDFPVYNQNRYTGTVESIYCCNSRVSHVNVFTYFCMVLAYFILSNILAYASTVLSSVGFHGNEAATLASTGFGVVKVGGTIPAVFLVDKVGPKVLLCVGAVVMMLSTATLGAVTLQSHTHVSSLCRGPVNKANLTVFGTGEETDFQTNNPLGLYQPSYNELQNKHKTNVFLFNDTKDHWILNYTHDYRTFMELAKGSEKDSSKIALQSLHVNEVSPSLKWISLVSLLVYVAGFSISLGPMVHVVLSAIFPTGIRGKAVSVISAFNWATNLLISMTFLTLTERIGLPTVIFSYAAMSFVLVVFVIVFVPETKGRSLEQISKELAVKNHLSSRLLHHRRKHEAIAQPSQEEKALTTV
uniref:Solute carrier family 2, facilitated glucose transporter member 12-like n=1 Tax=Sinocyclocheilus rhinocerous TaxID=307959 RepID=A0A673MTI7_9TELE